MRKQNFDGVKPLVDGDIWVDGSDLENYIFIANMTISAWVLVDNRLLLETMKKDGIIFNDFISY